MMHTEMGGLFSGMGYGNWMLGVLVLVVVIAAAAVVIASRKK